MPNIKWTDIRAFGVEGRGWSDVEHFYDRLPHRAKNRVPEAVWELAKHSAGMFVRFVTDATTISARWVLRHSELEKNHMPATGVSGLDLYVKDQNTWRWVGVGVPNQLPENETVLVEDLDGSRHELMLYLPLYNGVDSVHIGVDDESTIEPAPQAVDRPVCFYGTSILQGGCASRPGMAWPSIVGRRLGITAINLGFSGNGRMERELAQLLGELDVRAYVLDCLPNMTLELIEERLVPFIQILRSRCPSTPIVLVEKPTYPACPWKQELRQNVMTCNAANRAVFESCLKQGDQNMFYLSGEKLYGKDGEATVDGIHATDVGFLRIASEFEAELGTTLFEA